MKELLIRLGRRPALTVELLAVSFVANMLALASPLFVSLVLRRYVSYGVDATLYTLTAGVIIAIVLELGFRLVRLRLAREFGNDANLAIGAYGMLVSSRIEALDNLPAHEREQLLRNLEMASTAFSAPNISLVLDVPFAALFLIFLFLIDGTLGVIASCFIAAGFGLRLLSQHLQRASAQKVEQVSAVGSLLVSTTNRSPDSVRIFNAGGWLINAWSEYATAMATARARLLQKQGQAASYMMTVQGLLGVAIIGIGAMLVVDGKMDVGTLIAANILASRALAPVIRFAELTGVQNRGQRALERLRALAALDTEDIQKSIPDACHGALEFRDMAFSYPGLPSPLFESLNLSLRPGTILLVKGANGSGKTTLLRVVLGLLVPSRGQILLDGVDLRQISPRWWRLHVAYVPQEVHFFDTTVLENLRNANPDVNDEALHLAVEEAGLAQFFKESPQGLRTRIVAGASNLSFGVRRRLALARAFAGHRQVAVLDEPTEGLDSDGRMRIYQVMNKLAKVGCTIIVASDNSHIVKGAHVILDLDRKPKPGIHLVRPSAVTKEAL